MSTTKSKADTQPRKAHEIFTSTIRSNTFAYAHLQVTPEDGTPLELEILEAKSFCTAALSQFLGIAGTAVLIDILKVNGGHFWIRLSSQDLTRFAAAIAAWRGPVINDKPSAMNLVACSEWLGALVSQDTQRCLGS